MPVVLFSIDGTDNTSGAFQKATGALGNLSSAYDKASGQSSAFDRALAAVATSASRVESAQIRVQAATLRAALSMQQATSAADRYGSTIAQVATAGLSAEAAQIRLSSAFDASVAAQTRASTSALSVQDAYNKLAVAQDLAARNEQKMRAAMDAPLKTPTTGGSGGGSSELGGAVKNVLLYGLAYQAASDLMGQVEQGFTRALATSRTLSMTGATTGISPATQAALGGYVNNLAGSNTQPFTSDILATGLYAIPSAGVTNKKAIEAINKQSTQFSAFSGSPDTVTDNNALIQTMSAYGVAQNQMAVQAKKFQDVITSMVNLGIVNPADVAGSVTTFGSRAAQAQIPFNVAGGLFAASTYTTRDSQQSAQDEDAFIRSIIAPNQTQRTAGKILGVSNLLGQQGAALLGSDPRAYFQEAFQATKLNPGLDLTKLFGTSNAGTFAMGLIGSGGSNLNRTFGAISATSQPNTTQNAFNAYEKSPAAQFDNSVAAFKTAEQQFASAATPLATALLGFATSNVFAPLKALVDNPSKYAGGAGATLSNFLTPGSPGFLNITAARNQAATGQANTGIGPSIGNFLDGVANWMNHPNLGGAGTANAAGITTVPSNYAGPLLPNMRRAPGIVDSYRAPAPTITVPPTYIGPLLPNMRRAAEVPTSTFDMHAAQVASTQAAYQAQQQNATAAAAQARIDALYGPNSTTRGGAARPPDITAAAQRITEAIGNNAGKQTVESALGLYRQAVNNNPLLTSGTRAADILAQTGKVQRYERGMAGGADQLAVNSAQSAYTLAQQLNETPAQIKAVFDTYLAAQRQLVLDTTTKGSAAQARALGAINQQGSVFNYGQKGDAINRTLKDLQDQTSIDTAKGNTGAVAKDNAAVLAYQTAHAGFFKLDPQDIAAMAAQNAAALTAQNPTVNTHPFYDKQAGLGSFEAGAGSTLVRAGGVDPATSEIRVLRQELAAANARADSYLAQIANNTKVIKPQAAGSTSAQRGGRGTSGF